MVQIFKHILLVELLAEVVDDQHTYRSCYECGEKRKPHTCSITLPCWARARAGADVKCTWQLYGWYVVEQGRDFVLTFRFVPDMRSYGFPIYTGPLMAMSKVDDLSGL